MSFYDWFFNIDSGMDEEKVLCPFPHSVEGVEYYESNPSAYVNTENGLFHCKSCGRGYNEAGFIQAVTGSKLSHAHRLIPAFKNSEDLTAWKNEGTVQHGNLPLANEFNISDEVQKDLHLVSRTGTDIIFPVFMYNKLLDTRTYNPGEKPKVKSRIGAVAGLITPFDLWVDTPKSRWTIVCAGEKDMAVARTHGFNAITITGGENMKPIMPEFFRDRYVAICYDNDDPGIAGAKKLANFLLKYTSTIKVITNFHEDMEYKEDITDYFNKYNKTAQDLIDCMENTEMYEEEYVSEIPQVTLHEASLPQNTGKILRASIQVTAVSEAVYTMPTEIMATKYRVSEDPKANKMHAGEVRTWAVDEDNIQDLLHLVDNNFKEKQVRENMYRLAGVPFTERNVSLKTYGKYTIYKATVTDLFETSSDSHTPMEYLVYSTERLESGKKYNATFKVTPHPYQGQQLIMIVWSIDQAIDSISDFKLTAENKLRLNKFKSFTEEHGIEEAVSDSVERVKGLLGYNGINLLIETIDLAYHTPLTFSLGRFENVRAYLDTLIVGESRMGKSSTAETLRNTYGLGTFVSLAGNSATIPGLIGGSNKIGTSYQTKAGIIPQNHKGLMIFEEFGKCKADIISELTDIRSSNEVRITRVSGTLTLPAMVRMITLSNVKTLPNKEIRSIASYPHGIAVVTELVGSAEDIARYDILLVLGDKGNSISDPYWEPKKPHDIEDYRTKIRWVWSRTKDEIVISESVGKYIFTRSNELNKEYDSHIKIFGTEAWKKLARLAIAVASYVVSTDDSFENIIVKEKHVDYAYDLMLRIYDNDTFKLKPYVDHERKYSTTDDDSKEALERIFVQAPGVVLHLEQEHKTNKTMLQAASGLNNDQVNRIINQLIQCMFVKIAGNDIVPTERFRLTTPNINRKTIIKKVGEINGSSIPHDKIQK